MVRAIDQDGEIWFAGVDICNIMGLYASHLKRTLAPSQLGYISATEINGRPTSGRQLYKISLSGLLAAIKDSENPLKDNFKQWIYREVLPAMESEPLEEGRSMLNIGRTGEAAEEPVKSNTAYEKALNTFTYDFEPDCFDQPVSMDIRVIDLDGNPWFVAKDVAVLLGYVSAPNAVAQHCRKAISAKGHQISDLHPQTKLIPESDLYRLIMKSEMEEAIRFQDWVCEEVLPTIRKTGGTYMTDEALAKTLTDPDYLIGVLTEMKNLKTERDYAIATKGKISQGMLASAMGTASGAVRQLKAIKEKYEGGDMTTVRSLGWVKKFFKSVNGTHGGKLIGQDLVRLSNEYHKPPQKVHDDIYGNINMYHKDIVEIFKGRVKRGEVRPALKKYLREPEFA